MEGEEAMEIFKLVKTKGMLPQKMEELLPLSFIGQTAVNFYRTMIKGFDQLKTTEEQRKRTLKDGQEAGEMLLDIEARIGELLPSPSEAQATMKGQPAFTSKDRAGATWKELGIPQKRATDARKIASHPEIVEKVRAQARGNEDIPTRTAVINEIRYQREKERKGNVKEEQGEWRAKIAVEENIYIIALENPVPSRRPRRRGRWHRTPP